VGREKFYKKNTNINLNFREWLHKKRTKKNLTIREIAEKTNIDFSYYSLIENGLRNPSVDTAKKIALVLGFKWTKFFESEVA
jgi:transcriptional regulator with XRE-family HTH domain